MSFEFGRTLKHLEKNRGMILVVAVPTRKVARTCPIYHIPPKRSPRSVHKYWSHQKRACERYSTYWSHPGRDSSSTLGRVNLSQAKETRPLTILATRHIANFFDDPLRIVGAQAETIFAESSFFSSSSFFSPTPVPSKENQVVVLLGLGHIRSPGSHGYVFVLHNARV